MTCALDSFMNTLINDSRGCSSSMTIISDNARVMQGASRKRSAPKRSRSLPVVDRWEVPSRFEQKPFVRSLSPGSSDSNGGSLSRWESLTSGAKSQQSKESQSLTKPSRKGVSGAVSRRDWFASLDKAPQFVKRSQQDVFGTVQSLPVSLRSLPY